CSSRIPRAPWPGHSPRAGRSRVVTASPNQTTGSRAVILGAFHAIRPSRLAHTSGPDSRTFDARAGPSANPLAQLRRAAAGSAAALGAVVAAFLAGNPPRAGAGCPGGGAGAA